MKPRENFNLKEGIVVSFSEETDNLWEDVLGFFFFFFFFFCQTGNLRFSFIMYCNWRVQSVYTCQELTWWNKEVSEFSLLRKSTKSTSLIKRIWDFSITIIWINLNGFQYLLNDFNNISLTWISRYKKKKRNQFDSNFEFTSSAWLCLLHFIAP